MMQDLAPTFTREEVTPVANRLDPEKGDIGFFGITIPEEHGGLGLGAFEYCLVAEELARGWMSVASIIAQGNGFYRSAEPGEPRSPPWPRAAIWAPPRCRNRRLDRTSPASPTGPGATVTNG